MNTFASLALITVAWPYWLAWLGLFGVLEGTFLALRKKYPDVHDNGGTLSELVWWIIRGKQWPHRAAYYVLLTFFVDLGCHFFIGSSLLPFIR